jgi:predicted Zn-dependent peptidase
MFKRLPCLLLIAVLCVVAAQPASAAKTAPAEKTPARSITEQIQEVTLPNGLRIFVLERTTSPTFAAVYMFGVGGASDPKGKSGIAHLLEHMLFKGSTTVGTLNPAKEKELMQRLTELWHELHIELDRQDDPFDPADEKKIASLTEAIEKVSAEHKKLIVKNEYDELVTRAGGVSLNASTSNDTTSYYLQLPANRLEFWFKMESDRLLNPVFREFYSERDVVYEERRMRTENSARGRGYEAMRSILYPAHPYGTPVVGWPRDVERLTREDAMVYFLTYYSPSNCVMALVGDITAKQVEKLAKKYFSSWERQEIPRLAITAEPEQQGERRGVVEFDARPRIDMAWVTVPEGHEDMFALDVLSRVLGGLWSSRIDKTIVQEERIAANAGTNHRTMKYSGYFGAGGTLRGDHTAAELEVAIEREIKKIQDEGATEVELERAKIATEVSRVRSLKSNLGQAFRIASVVRMTGSTGYLDDYERKLNAVTVEDVQSVAEQYLTPARKCVVQVRKVEGAGSGSGGGSGVSHSRGGASSKRGANHSSGFRQSMAMIKAAKPVVLKTPEVGKDVDRVELSSGVTVFIKEDRAAPSVDMAFTWLGGSNTTPVEQLAPFRVAGDLLDEGGTAALDPIALQDRKDELGMSFGIGVGSTQSWARFWSLSRNFTESFDLALDIMMHPRFDAERLATLKGQYIESMRRRYDSPGSGVRTLQSYVLNKDHPRLGYVPSKAEIEAVTADDVRKIWQTYLGRDNLYITAVGDFDKQAMLALLEDRLGSWRKAENSEREYIQRAPVIKPGLFLVEKEVPQPAIRIGHQIKVDRSVPKEDHAALEILNDILGGSGFRSRLMERLRSDEGLTYGIGSWISHESRKDVPGIVGISYQTKKDSVEHSLRSVTEEFVKIIEEQVSEAEVEEQIEAWRNAFIFRYTNDFFSVNRLMANELDDRPYDFDALQLEEIQKVKVGDVQRVAEKYLNPDNLTICVFGLLTDDDKAALAERYELKIFPKEEIFTGGYDEPDGSAG